ncbi:ABC transporter [Candidatus Protofrankia californiensis]|uniref:ABC transporter n=1 Tax=Candidatus Protofrankia californiensis TaxID=1839754 RepID=A0A1C3NXL4_9ACTN|nr:ABC transporter [Candidatus Protofrankia californiensis]
MTNNADVVLEVRHVSKRFGNHAALNGVSFTVARNEVLALLGDNGAGKSTLVKSIAGLHKPDEGEILLKGRPLTSETVSDIGFVYQDLALFDNLTVAENLFAGTEPCWPRRLGGWGVVKPKAMLAEARKTLDRLEVRIPNIKSPVGLLSGGQRQAIAVCKGMAFAKDLVVLDEPTAALGLRERRNVLRLVKQLPETGISVILISHNLEEVVSVADRAVVLRQGVKVGETPATQENHERIVSMIVGGQPIDASA